jgi:hypothetical protein
MLKNITHLTVTLVILCVLSSCQRSKIIEESAEHVSLVENDSLNRLDIFLDGKYFTSYLHADTVLRKPVLFPIHSASGERITRGYPFAPNEGERTDHPHHYGLWFNHGDVNGIDFWNSSVTSRSPKARYGKINHTKFLKVQSGDVGILEVEKEWRNETNELILLERTKYVFSGDSNVRVIDHTSTLVAPEVDVLFRDSKEGMFAMRVRRELEIPSDEPVKLLSSDLVLYETGTIEKRNVSGKYRNSDGLEGYPDVWGKRARWMQLSGIIKNDSISICILDHPDNINHPPHWMARDYGLYGVNSMGSNVYSEGKEQLNFLLKKGNSLSLRHQVIIVDGSDPSSAEIEDWYRTFASNSHGGVK